ncbi:MAG: stealth conserved region 3 domain-containing protein [Polyangiaceae bacterium]
MRRLRKLLENPRRFLDDGVENFLTRAGRLPDVARLGAAALEKDTPALGFADRLVRQLLGTAPLHREGEVLHARRADRPWILAHALLLARQRGLRPRLGDLRHAQGDASELRFDAQPGRGVALQLRFDDAPLPASHFVDVGHLFPPPPDHALDVDLVYTWVNHADPWWRDAIARHRPSQAIDWDRYIDADELRYSLRSVQAFAPWARRIYLVTNCSPPRWLADHPRVRLVSHEAIFPDTRVLPTFNSHAIESCLARIDGLSEHFVYFNDDMFLGRVTSRGSFFTPDGRAFALLEPGHAVHGERSADRPDYLNAAINGRELLRARFGVAPDRLHQHAPYALRRSVYAELEATFPDAFARVRAARFRSLTDISTASFLCHHFAAFRGLSLESHERSQLIQERHAARAHRVVQIRRPLFFCINDGRGSTQRDAFAAFKREVMTTCFPEPAPWEKG